MLKLILFIPILFLYQISTNSTVSDDNSIPEGPAIDWSPDRQLKWSDFKALHKTANGFAVATSTCGFGYDGIISGNEIRINVYVKFYCNESWYDKDFEIKEVLRHEQLHFDICELYGRLFYKQILLKREKGELNENTLKKILNKLRNEYDAIQDKYDDETSNSTNRSKQFEWDQRIHEALQKNAAYAHYKEF